MQPEPRIVPFGDEHLDAASRLVAERHARLRAAEPALADRWTDPADARSLVESAARAERATGFVALDEGRVVGFLVGQLRVDAPWDRAGWVELAGHAVDPAAPDLAQDLFAAWSAALVGQGVFRYLVNVPALDRDAVERWHRLSFGQMHCSAVRETDPATWPAAAAGIVVRPAGPGDEALMEATSEIIWREQVGAPSWSPITGEQIAALRRAYVDELTEDDFVWVAMDEANGEPLGVTVSYPLDPDLDVPDGNMKLASTTTFPAARRRGVARTLLRAVLRNAAERGAAWCVTDWRTSSLRASRTWTSLGFRPTRLRLERRIDERMAWADGSA